MTVALAPRKVEEPPISAVEALCRSITPAKTLGDALKTLDGAGLKVHPALRDSWLKVYGWSSDADGIRHGSAIAPVADQALAKYVLVASSAFVSYLTETSRKAGLL